MNSLKIKTIVNIGYVAVARVANLAFSGAASIILAQNLSSSDYGIVGFATIFIGFLAQFSDLGINSAVIQKSDLDERGLYTGFTIKFFIGNIIFGFAFFLSPVTKVFFDNDAVEMVMIVLSLNFLLNTFSFLPNCLLVRDLNYKKIFLPDICSSLIGSITSIILALSGFKYWSIVYANLSSSVVRSLILNILKPVKIRFRFNKEIAAEFIHYGGFLFLSGFFVYAIFNADNFIIGAVKGSQELGYYALAFNWGSMICGILFSTVNSVLFPTFSRKQDDRDWLKKNYLRVLEYLSFLAVLGNAILFAVAPDFLFFILGHGTDKWHAAINAFKILCIYGIFRALLEPVGNIFLALGKTNMLFRSTVIVAVLELSLLYPSIKYFGIEGAAIVVTIAYAMQYFVYFPFLKKNFNLNYNEVWVVAKPAILSGIFAVIIITAYSEIFKINSLFFMFQKIFLGSVGFLLLHGILTKWKFVYETKSLINHLKLKSVPSPKNTP